MSWFPKFPWGPVAEDSELDEPPGFSAVVCAELAALYASALISPIVFFRSCVLFLIYSMLLLDIADFSS